jgi:aspartate-semialdehyde dehydrogenase
MADVGVVGPSSLVGGEILEVLAERAFPTSTLRFFGSMHTAGGWVERAGKEVRIDLARADSFNDLDVVFFAAGPTVAGEFAPAAAEAGATVVDCSSRFRLDPDVPLVVPEVNPEMVPHPRVPGILASPSATAVGLAVVLGPLAAAAGLVRVVVSTYQGAAGGGRRLVHRFGRDTVALLNAQGEGRSAGSLAFDCLPRVGTVEPGGATTHELHVVEETRKVLGEPELALSITAVRVPTFFGYGASIHLDTARPLTAAEATEVLRTARGVIVHDEAADLFPTPAGVAGSDATHVGRVRDDPGAPNGLALWIALDSVRKGGAVNAVQIAEIAIRER